MSRATAVLCPVLVCPVLLGLGAALAGCTTSSTSGSTQEPVRANPPEARSARPQAVVLDPLEALPRRQGQVDVHGDWGSGRGQFGLYRPSLRGPTSFDVTPRGGVVIVDQQNHRIVLRARARTTTLVNGIRPIYYDVAVGTGTLYLLAVNGEAAGDDVLTSFRINDGSVIDRISVGTDADAIRVVAGDLYVHSLSRDWTLGTARDAPGRPAIATEDGGRILVQGGRGRTVTIVKSDQEGQVSWRLTSAENVGVVAVSTTADGVRAVLVRWTDTTRSFQYVDLGPGGVSSSFVLPDQHYTEMTAMGEFRFAGDFLYRAARTHRGFSVYRYRAA